MRIIRSLLKNGYSNFNLEILEYCDPENLIEREQYYIDFFKPEYNILKFAKSSKGYKHSENALKKLRVHLEKLNKEKGFMVTVKDTQINTITTYPSIRSAALSLKVDHSSVRRNLNSKNLLKKRYIITSAITESKKEL